MHVRESRATHNLMPWNGRKLFRIHNLLSLRGVHISVIWYVAPFDEDVLRELNVTPHMKLNILDLLFNNTHFFRKILSEFLVVLYMYVDRDSSFGFATRCHVVGPGIESQSGEIFRTCPERPWVLSCFLYNVYRVSFPGDKAQWREGDHPTPCSTKVKERVELHLYSPSVSSWQVTGWNLPYLCTIYKNTFLIIYFPTAYSHFAFYHSKSRNAISAASSWFFYF
jgi:hypothetical protein